MMSCVFTGEQKKKKTNMWCKYCVYMQQLFILQFIYLFVFNYMCFSDKLMYIFSLYLILDKK